MAYPQITQERKFTPENDFLSEELSDALYDALFITLQFPTIFRKIGPIPSDHVNFLTGNMNGEDLENYNIAWTKFMEENNIKSKSYKFIISNLGIHRKIETLLGFYPVDSNLLVNSVASYFVPGVRINLNKRETTGNIYLFRGKTEFFIQPRFSIGSANFKPMYYQFFDSQPIRGFSEIYRNSTKPGQISNTLRQARRN